MKVVRTGVDIASFWLSLCLSTSPALLAQSEAAAPPHLAAVRSEAPIRIDGVLEEPVWQGPGCEAFRQTDPVDGAAPTERTVVRFAFDRKNLYVAARLHDASPGAIVSRLGRRDEAVDSDWFDFAIDPYLDRRSGFLFSVNPAGSIQDGTLFNDEDRDLAWDGVWESAARVDAAGWMVEIRIPFDQLRFPAREEYTWGVNCRRLVKRTNEEAVLSWRPKEESGFVSRFALLSGIRDIDPGGLNELLPFAVGRGRFRPAEPGNPFRTGRDFGADAGFDFKSTLRSNLTLNLTVNPDFGQVEVDPAVINITDQETYYQEKRPFFVEGADIFRFGGGGANQVRELGWNTPAFFYSRRIGRRPQGGAGGGGFADSPDWTTILGAVKLTGKMAGGWNVGVLSAATARESARIDLGGERSRREIEPAAGYGVVRALKEMDDGGRGVGIIATSVVRGIESDSLDSVLAQRAFSLAMDGWSYLDRSRTWVLTGWFGGTRVEGSPDSITRLQTSSMHYYQRPEADYVRLDPEATSLGGWAGRIYLNKQKGNVIFNAGLGAMSPGFDAMDLGYHARGDKINGHVEAGYQSFHPGRLFRSWRVILQTYRNYDFGGVKFDEMYNLSATSRFLNYWSANLYFSYDPNRYSHWLTRGGPLALLVWGFTRRVTVTTDDRRNTVYSLGVFYRTHPDSHNYSIDASVRWRPSANFSLSVGPEYSWRHSIGQFITKIPDPSMTETYGIRYICSDIVQETLAAEIRLSWTFTPKLSLQAYLQPFLGTGDYTRFKEFARPKTFDFNLFGENGSTIAFEGGFYRVDPDGPGPAAPFAFREPDFNMKSMRGTVVLRWEYLPGSTAYAVWTQNRADYSHPGDFDPGRDLGLLLEAPGENIFLLKFSYRFGL